MKTLLAALLVAQATSAPPRSEILAAARDIIRDARYCSLVTVGDGGQPQARIVDPLAPDERFTLWVATNPLTRKVADIKRNPRATMLCFDAASSSYVTIVGRAAIVDDEAEKRRHWKDEWSGFYELRDGKRDFTLIRLTPTRLEIVSAARGLVGDPKTWLPLSVVFQ